MLHVVKLEQFEGPLDLLLSFIEDEKLDISSISLGKVTEQYLLTLEAVEEKNPEELSDFLVVAAKLLLIKSRLLLPDLVPEKDTSDLERSLRMLKEYRDAAQKLEKLIAQKRFMYVREDLPQIEPFFVPPGRVTTDRLRDLFSDILGGIAPMFALSQEVVRRTISAKEKLQEIQAYVSRELEIHFSHLVKKAASRQEVIVTFLVLLELVKRRTVTIAQDGRFGEMVIKKV